MFTLYTISTSLIVREPSRPLSDTFDEKITCLAQVTIITNSRATVNFLLIFFIKSDLLFEYVGTSRINMGTSHLLVNKVELIS